MLRSTRFWPGNHADAESATEIDDALSVVRLPGIGSRIGIHIAAPGLAIEHGSPLDGMDDFLPKPVNAHQLKATLEKWLPFAGLAD